MKRALWCVALSACTLAAEMPEPGSGSPGTGMGGEAALENLRCMPGTLSQRQPILVVCSVDVEPTSDADVIDYRMTSGSGGAVAAGAAAVSYGETAKATFSLDLRLQPVGSYTVTAIGGSSTISMPFLIAP